MYFEELTIEINCGFCEDLLRCILTKKGSEMRELKDLLTHLNRKSDFTLSKDRILKNRSSGRVTFTVGLMLISRRNLDGTMIMLRTSSGFSAGGASRFCQNLQNEIKMKHNITSRS
jgi:hypothetical protein